METSSRRIRATGKAARHPAAAARDAAQSEPPRVLLAEDDADMRQWLAQALRRAGYAVVQAADGKQLRELVDRMLDGRLLVAVDVVVADVRMPGCSGLDVLRRLRHADWSTPVLLMTAFGDDETVAEAQRLGVVALLEKPFDLDTLLQRVAQAAPHDAPPARPRQRRAGRPPAAAADRSGHRGPRQPPARGPAPLRIALAEDDAEMRALLAAALRRHGHLVTAVADGAQLIRLMGAALHDARASRFDLVLSDIRLPGAWSGLAILACLKTHKVDVPIVLVTAFGDEWTHAEARKLGAVAVIDKPFDIEGLCTWIEGWRQAPATTASLAAR